MNYQNINCIHTRHKKIGLYVYTCALMMSQKTCSVRRPCISGKITDHYGAVGVLIQWHGWHNKMKPKNLKCTRPFLNNKQKYVKNQVVVSVDQYLCHSVTLKIKVSKMSKVVLFFKGWNVSGKSLKPQNIKCSGLGFTGRKDRQEFWSTDTTVQLSEMKSYT